MASRPETREAQPVAGGHCLPEHAQLDAHEQPLPGGTAVGCSCDSRCVRLSTPRLTSCDDAVGRDVAQAHSDERERLVGAELEHGDRPTEQLQPLGQRLGRQAERARVLVTLVGRLVGRSAVGTPGAGVEAVPLVAGQLSAASAASASPSPRSPSGRRAHVDRRRRPLRLRDPAAWPLRLAGRRRPRVPASRRAAWARP